MCVVARARRVCLCHLISPAAGPSEVFAELQVHDACLTLTRVDAFGLTVLAEMHGELEVISTTALGSRYSTLYLGNVMVM